MKAIEINDGTQDVQEEIAYQVSLDNPVCPCCGKPLKVIDSMASQFDEPMELTMENLNENALSEYLLDICAEEAMNIYDNEIQTHEPYLDHEGHITPEYNERFEYTDPNLKKVVKVKANAISNKLANDGIQVHPYYIENEIIEMLKHVQ